MNQSNPIEINYQVDTYKLEIVEPIWDQPYEVQNLGLPQELINEIDDVNIVNEHQTIACHMFECKLINNLIYAL